MAFRRTTAAAEHPPADDAVIPRLDDDVEFAKLLQMERAIRAALLNREQRIELHYIQGELQRPTTSTHGPRIAMLRERAEVLKRETEKPEPPPEADAMPLPLKRALELAAGGEVAEPPDRSKRLARLQAEQRILEAGLGPITRDMDELRDQRSLEIAQQLRPAHIEVMRTIWQAAASLSAAIDRERQLFAQPILGGYTPRPDVLLRPALRSAAVLGSLAEWDAEISHFRRRLEEQGVI